METTSRSALTAAAAAVVIGASAIPSGIPATAVPAGSAPAVALAAFDSPFAALLGTVRAVSVNLFDGSDTYSDYPWDPYRGLGPEFIYTALPIISQLGFNGLNYINGSIDALSTSAELITGALWNLPGAVVTAAGQAITGQFAEALATLTAATLVPLQNAGEIALGAGLAVFGNALTNLTDVLVSVPGIIGSLLTTLQGGATAVLTAAFTIGAQTVAALSSLNLEGAWNTLVNGLLGPVGGDGLVTSSLPGTLLAVTVGPGVGPLGHPDGYAVPSLRMWGERTQLTIANALGANFPVTVAPSTPAASTPRPSAARAVATAAEAAESAAPEAGAAEAAAPTADSAQARPARAPERARAASGSAERPSGARPSGKPAASIRASRH